MTKSFVLVVLGVLCFGASDARADYQSGEYQSGARTCRWGSNYYSWDQGSSYYHWNQCEDVASGCREGQSYGSSYWRQEDQYSYSRYQSRWEYCTNGYYNSCSSYGYSSNGQNGSQPEQCYSSGERPASTSP